MKTHKNCDLQPVPVSESDVSDLMPYIKAARDKFPSKEELFSEVNKDRDSRKKIVKTLQYTVALAFCAFGVWTINPTISSETYTTTYAQNEQFSLPDGSGVHLNSNTTLTARFRLFSRELHLEKGEASFSVKHELRPFTVAVNAAKVLDIGTVFNLSKSDQAFIATVVEGEVELQTGGAKNRLTAGQSINVSNTKTGSPYIANMEVVTAWQAGKIIFNKTPLKEAVASIQRYRKEPIQLDPSVGEMLMTGIYDVSSIEQLLDSMGTMFPVKVSRFGEGEIKIQKN